MSPLNMWMCADFIKLAGAAPSLSSGSSMRGGLLRGGVLGGGIMAGGEQGAGKGMKKGLDPELAHAPAALRRGAMFSKTIGSAFTPRNPFKVPNLQQTIRIMTLGGNKHKLPGMSGVGMLRATVNKLPV